MVNIVVMVANSCINNQKNGVPAIATLLTGIAISQGMLNIFISIALLGLGIIIMIANVRITRIFYKWFAHYLQSKIKTIRGANK